LFLKIEIFAKFLFLTISDKSENTVDLGVDYVKKDTSIDNYNKELNTGSIILSSKPSPQAFHNPEKYRIETNPYNSPTVKP
jgi:hypothetical protein